MHEPLEPPTAPDDAIAAGLQVVEAGVQPGSSHVSTVPLDFLLSVVMPVFNEINTLAEILSRVRNCGIRCEIIVVDDGSTDGTRELLATWHDQPDLRIHLHPKNCGKGAALKTGFLAAQGDIVLVQDADLEYDPSEYARLIEPIVAGKADVVFGSRFCGANRRDHHLWHVLGNWLITRLSNAFTHLQLTDVETCYKVFRRDVLCRLAPKLTEQRFGIEPELTAKLARLPGVRICERPISYAGRTYAEGKKIGWRDACRTLYCIVRYGLRD